MGEGWVECSTSKTLESTEIFYSFNDFFYEHKEMQNFTSKNSYEENLDANGWLWLVTPRYMIIYEYTSQT